MSGRQFKRLLLRLCDAVLAPGLCLACGSELDHRDHLCATCATRLTPVPNPCAYCGQPNPADGRVCPACLLNPPRWQNLIAPLQYQGLTREYLHRLKFAGALHHARTLGSACLEQLRQGPPRPEALLPVPLHRSRLLERGYNQADEIAKLWSQWLDIPCDRRALSRRRATASQAELSAAQRVDNLRGAFVYRPRRAYRHVAVVDDVVTTGSTVGEICKVLHRGGVDFVEVWALARAYRD